MLAVDLTSFKSYKFIFDFMLDNVRLVNYLISFGLILGSRNKRFGFDCLPIIRMKQIFTVSFLKFLNRGPFDIAYYY